MENAAGPSMQAEKESPQIIAAVFPCYCFSGAMSLIYEGLWTRLLGLVFGHGIFAITTILAAFMAGLGMGSYLFGRTADRHGHPVCVYGLLEAGIGTYAPDDLPHLEFSAPDSLYANTVEPNRCLLRAFRRTEFPPIVGLPEVTLRSPNPISSWESFLPYRGQGQGLGGLSSGPATGSLECHRISGGGGAGSDLVRRLVSVTRHG